MGGWRLGKEGLNARLRSLVSCSLFAFPEILLARFANTRVMLFPEILDTTHPDPYVLVTSRASDCAFVDGQVWVCTFGGFLKVTGTRSDVQGSSVAV
jgi:hypothetical protein